MYSIIVNILFAVVAQANAKGQIQDFMGELMDKFVNRAKVLPIYHADLDDTALLKGQKPKEHHAAKASTGLSSPIKPSSTDERSSTYQAQQAAAADGAQDAQTNMDKMKDALTEQIDKVGVEAVKKKLEDPKVQEQIKFAAEALASPQFKEKTQSWMSDPELAPFFEDMKSGGMAAIGKYMQDPNFLHKLGERVGDIKSMITPETGDESKKEKEKQEAEKESKKVTTLVEAARAADLKAAEELLAGGSDPNEKDDQGRTALHFAAAKGSVPIVKALLEAGADIQSTDQQGCTPLYFAAGYGWKPVVALLLDRGADVTVNTEGKSPADAARISRVNQVKDDEELLAKLEANKAVEPSS